nr:14749_t:CDS:2 [Entrophospora candida]
MLEDQQNPFSIKYLSHDLSDEIIENSAVVELQLAGLTINGGFPQCKPDKGPKLIIELLENLS